MIYTNKFEHLNETHFEIIDKCYKSGEFRDGNATALYDDDRKYNREMVGNNPHTAYHNIVKLIKKCVESDTHFQTYTTMVKTSSILLSEYTEGMYYKKHSDSHAMLDSRNDWSCTLFLNNPDEYEGGELKLYVGNEDRSVDIKLNRGEYVLYPTGMIHEVTKVTSGSRRVCVFWIQSALQDRALLEMYTDLVLLLDPLRDAKSDVICPDLRLHLINTLVKVRGNLLRNYGHFNYRSNK